ncbi:MAG: CotH kinase family protein [Agathobacter sp.]|nr:CotH kinase family protein [Agathobacter sp.]
MIRGRALTGAIICAMGIAGLCGCAMSENEEEKNPIEFSVESGCYEEAFDLKLTTGDGGAIYYTLDGSDPADSATRIEYTESIHIEDRRGAANVVSAVEPNLFDTAFAYFDKNTDSVVSYATAPSDDAVDKCTVVRAVSIAADGGCSDTMGKTYFIGDMTEHIIGIEESCEAATAPLAVISISMDYDDLFDEENGIYVRGSRFENALTEYLAAGGERSDDCGRKLDANYSQRGREWEREAHIDFFESDGTSTQEVLSQNCGIRIQGNYSRSDLQKGFRLYARTEYGDKRFRYPIFPEKTDDNGKPVETYKSFILRNGGNCAFISKFNDTYWQSMLAEMDCDTQNSRPAVVYLNGEYWGLYILQEDYSDEYFEDTHGVISDDVVLYKGDAERYASGFKLDLGKLPEGETDERYYFAELNDFFVTHKDLSDESDYEKFCKLVDKDSCRDYFAVESWINNKWDWPGKNWAMWKTVNVDPDNPYADGRWRFNFYDIEFGGICGESEASANTIREDNYTKYGLLDKATSNPAVLCFAYLMTNAKFREEFYQTLNDLGEKQFSYENANAVLEQFEGVYGPLYEQFFARYPGTGSREEALSGGYGSVKCIRGFLQKRNLYIQNMIDYCKEHYGEM